MIQPAIANHQSPAIRREAAVSGLSGGSAAASVRPNCWGLWRMPTARGEKFNRLRGQTWPWSERCPEIYWALCNGGRVLHGASSRLVSIEAWTMIRVYAAVPFSCDAPSRAREAVSVARLGRPCYRNAPSPAGRALPGTWHAKAAWTGLPKLPIHSIRRCLDRIPSW